MQVSKEQDQKLANMKFSSVYPHYLNKVEKKGRTKEELLMVINWLTGFGPDEIDEFIRVQISFEEFFNRAQLNPNATLIKGLICGYRVEEIDYPLTQKVRYLDKLVDELAKGKSLDKIFRK